MKVHYFQRYHKSEDVATANTMLLLSRLYQYSTDKFYTFMKGLCAPDSEWDFSPGLSFSLQESGPNSRPDAVIMQDSLKIVIETKIADWFHNDQLLNHLAVFNNEHYKILLTISKEHMAADKIDSFGKQLRNYNFEHKDKIPILHVDVSFEELIDAYRTVLDVNDFNMIEIYEDYVDYCLHENLIGSIKDKNTMRVRLAGTTFDFNVCNNVYYDVASHTFGPYGFLGLYKQKSVKAIGKIIARIRAEVKDDEVNYTVEEGELNKEREQCIENAINNADIFSYNLRSEPHRFFFVEKFYDTDFRKESKFALRGSKNFDLLSLLDVKELPEVATIADLLKSKTW